MADVTDVDTDTHHDETLGQRCVLVTEHVGVLHLMKRRIANAPGAAA
ncbi:hypothetical protein [Streptomyces litchfieldiae]|uniref:Uncharacterized protein n=1 Tax=Streptomyces litchfieldiae TaxID=3075543 RepID=A0ABU2MTM9_9ACTN|nr:hypothetical protein [Streptomyces sp. DSM 44938]MDT0344996.1 hypothetical protein [Streptomyces sp. DSM 44938]